MICARPPTPIFKDVFSGPPLDACCDGEPGPLQASASASITATGASFLIGDVASSSPQGGCPPPAQVFRGGALLERLVGRLASQRSIQVPTTSGSRDLPDSSRTEGSTRPVKAREPSPGWSGSGLALRASPRPGSGERRPLGI